MPEINSIPLPPLITVIVATYNAEKTLQRCIDSIINQTHENVELIVIDGGSTDTTNAILKSHIGSIAYWISEPDSGIYSAWNKALEHANGEWICFLGADDFLYQPDVFARLSSSLVRAYPAARIVYARVAIIVGNGEIVDMLGEPWTRMREKFLTGTCLPTPGVMHHRSLFAEHGKFDESFLIAGDYEMLLRELKAADAIYVSAIILTGMQHGGVSSLPVNAMASIHEVGRALKIHHLYKLHWRWLAAIARIKLRQVLWVFLGERRTRHILDLGRRLIGKRQFWTRT